MSDAPQPGRGVKITALAVVTVLSYLLIEVCAFLAVAAGLPLQGSFFKSYAAWSRPAAQFDPHFGYRLAGPPFSGILIREGKLQFDYRDIRINNAGFRANQDYESAKRHRFRVIVYGDSFSAGWYLDRPWPEVLEATLRQTGIDAEVMNFSFDGGGMGNWLRHFQTQVNGKIPYDLLVLAVCCNDLHRAVTVYHPAADGSAVMYGKFARPPRDAAELANEFLPSMTPMVQTAPAERIERLAAAAGPQGSFLARLQVLPVDLYALRAVREVVGPHVTAARAAVRRTASDLRKSVKLALGLTRPQPREPAGSAATDGPATPPIHSPTPNTTDFSVELTRMAEDARRSGATVALVALPDDLKALLARQYSAPANAAEVEREAKRLCAAAINGYRAFDTVEPTALRAMWPSVDGHWLQPAVDHFGVWLAPHVGTLLTQRGPGC